MVSALYAVLGALLLVKFSFDVVRLRTQYHVGYGDGGFSELQVAHPRSRQCRRICADWPHFAVIYGDERRSDLDGARLRDFINCRATDALPGVFITASTTGAAPA